MKNKYSNSKAKEKKSEINQYISIWNENDLLSKRCKFNFHYFSPSYGGENFSSWSKQEINNLLDKLKAYSENSLEYWKQQSTAGYGNVLVIYGNFPETSKTNFKEPKHIPIEAKWARFRLGSKIRVIGFILSNSDNDKVHSTTGCRFDSNTFYIVFLDKEHKFYITEPK